MSKRLKAAAAFFALLTPLATANAASAQPVEAPSQTADARPEVIQGGTTQSTDPTAYNYVPEGADSNTGIQPQSASGAEIIRGFGFEWQGVPIQVPLLTLNHQIIGQGTHIQSETANISATASQICNWRVDYQNRFQNQIYATYPGATHWDCSFGSASDVGPSNINVRPGAQCARLYVMGEFRGEQCHAIN